MATKLNEDHVREIADAYGRGETQAQIAARHGVRQSTIGFILRGETWRHVERTLYAVGRGGYATNGLAQTIHGHASENSPSYRTWRGMLTRCNNPADANRHNYGGRGIRVCDRWRTDFAAFLADMGERPSDDHSIDRIDVNGNYEPGNCRWATPTEQANNTRTNRLITIDGTTHTMAEWARLMGVRDCVPMNRIRRGWSEQDAVLQPRRFKRLAT